MDIFDQAQANDELFRQSALRAHFAGRRSTHSERPKTGRHSTEAAPVGGHNRACCDCGDDIEPERLEALPYAVRCLGCQTKHERRARHG